MMPIKETGFRTQKSHTKLCGPALTAYGSLDLRQEIQTQNKNVPSVVKLFGV
jgi:hypothetical protein